MGVAVYSRNPGKKIRLGPLTEYWGSFAFEYAFN